MYSESAQLTKQIYMDKTTIFCYSIIEVNCMYEGLLNLKTTATIGFAHHFYIEGKYDIKYGMDRGIEIVYVSKGTLYGEYKEYKFRAEEGDFLVIVRHLPIRLYIDGENKHSHCSIQLNIPYEYEDSLHNGETKGIPVPIVVPMCEETKQLKNELFAIVSRLNISREGNELSATIIAMYILESLSRLHRNRLDAKSPSKSILEYKVKKYISANIHTKLTISNIAFELGKSPNYLNFVFKKSCGENITQYINSEKVRLICEMIHLREIPFKTACENVGIEDLSYGYRLFKKHTGLTPGKYLQSKKTLI